jgi:chromosome segregation ATPase
LENELSSKQADSSTASRSRIALDDRIAQLTKNVNDLNRQLQWEQQRNQDLINQANEAPQLSKDDIGIYAFIHHYCVVIYSRV